MFVPKINTYLIIVITVIFILSYSYGFNLSPKPNVIFKEPNLPTVQRKIQSSYFGFSLLLRANAIIVGAPRAQSTLDSQVSNNETGAIYKCNFGTGNCLPYVFDNKGDSVEDGLHTNERETKDFQWLGMVVDGNSKDTDKIVVCAPRILTDNINDHLMHGVCYWTPNSTDDQPLNVRKIAALRLKSHLTLRPNAQSSTLFYHAFGQQGISAHITDNDEEIIIGAPGIINWSGSVIRYSEHIPDDIGGLSRRRRNVDDDISVHSIVKRNIVEYRSDIPNPLHWNQQQDSYFGYAVSSGYFEGPESKKMLYVASAPRTNLQQGEVYIFDIVPFAATLDTTIKIYYKFLGNNIGEFFGYALLTEDFNNDGFPDVAIAAPFHEKRSNYECGAVHTYINLGSTSDGKWSANFEISTTLMSNYDGPGRFGTAISKIGDINLDGYNDIAVGSPYEDNGAIYIFLGGPNGLLPKFSQRIIAPVNEIINDPLNPVIPIQSLFGYGLSKGVDVDGNNYLDLAIGAPNSETIYLYKSYPVVKVIVSLTSQPTILQATDTSFKLTACWSFDSRFEIQLNTNINVKITVDEQISRAKFSNDLNQIEFNTTANSIEQCTTYDLSVLSSLNDIYKPIDLDMYYEVLDGVPNSEVFCTSCVAVNPTDPKILQEKLVFSTGCKSIICVTDLNIQSNVKGNTDTFLIGSSKTLIVDYVIRNNGETAFLAIAEIFIPDTVSFTKIPWNCLFINGTMSCNINYGKPLFNGEETLLQIIIDMTRIEGQQLVIKANVFSSSEELNMIDNVLEDFIQLKEFSDIEIVGKTSKSLLNLQDGLKIENITHLMEIRNNGPSNLKEIDVIISVPIMYLKEWSLEWETLIDFNKISLKAQYNNQYLTVDLIKDDEILIQNPESPVVIPVPLIIDSPNGMAYDTSNVGLEYDLSGGEVSPPSEGQENYRRKRFVADEMMFMNRYYNRYTQNVQEIRHNIRRRRSVRFQDDTIISNLPINRTILFDCHYETASALCIKGKFSVHNFKSGNNPILVSYIFDIDLSKIDKILTDKRDIFVIRTIANINKTGDENGNAIEITQTSPYTIISKYLITSTPIWVYVVSTLSGLLVLILITYGLYRFGFFKRAKKEEMEQLARESQPLNQPPAETDNEN